MKNSTHFAFIRQVRFPLRALLLTAACLGIHSSLQAGDRTAATSKPATAAKPAATANTTQSDAINPDVIQTAPETPDYVNWIEVGTGGIILNGDREEFKKRHSMNGDVYGGIQDMHYQRDFSDGVSLTLDGHAILPNKDYNIEMELSKVDLGYIKAGYNQYRTWYNGDSYFPDDGAKNFNDDFEDELAVDRGSMWVELGLRMPDVPQITLRYEHDYRNGQKDSTIWGPTNYIGVPPFGAGVPAGASTTSRLYIPAFRDINEKRDTLTAEGTHTFGNTEVNVGMRYEYSTQENTIYETRNLGQVSAAASRHIRITQEEDLDSDLFSGHGSTVTRFNDNLWLTSGYSYTTMETEIGGSRIYGQNFDAEFNPAGASPQGNGFINLGGGGTVNQHVGNLNLMWMPCEGLTITPELRVENTNINSDADYEKTKVSPQAVRRFVTVTSANEYLTTAEALEIRYAGLNDWVFYGRAELEQENGQRRIDGDNAYNTAGTYLDLDEGTNLMRQKYTVGANWYPLPKLNFSAQYYHKVAMYSTDIHDDDPITVDNQRMENLNIRADDVNFRATWRPWSNLSLVSRYDYLHGTTSGRWKDPEERFTESESTKIVNHAFSETLTWNPFTRWYLQGSGSYVLNSIRTPATDNVATPFMQDSENNYYTASFGTGLTLDDKTNLRADCTYLKYDNFNDNSGDGMPYGGDSMEYSVSLSLSRQISPAVRVTLQYAYYNLTDDTSGNYSDYDGHMIYAGTLVRF